MSYHGKSITTTKEEGKLEGREETWRGGPC